MVHSENGRSRRASECHEVVPNPEIYFLSDSESKATSMDRLVFNTPSRFGDGSEQTTKFIAFILFFLGFLALFCVVFMIWYVAAPVSRDRFFQKLNTRIAGEPSEREIREYNFLFSDAPAEKR